MRLGGAHEMARGADGLWMATLPAQVVGFHYYSIVIDGAVVADPATRFSEALTNARIKNVYFESPGTAHEWLTWRRCFYDFAPRLFR